MVHRGFKDSLGQIWDEVEEYLLAIDSPVLYTGHSLGAALATLAAARSKRLPQAVYTFGSPRVGNVQFAHSLSNIRIYRVVNRRDVVTTVPPAWLGFRHVGEVHHMTRPHYISVDLSGKTRPANDQKGGDSLKSLADYFGWFDPPEFLADHAPVNYVAGLERQA